MITQVLVQFCVESYDSVIIRSYTRTRDRYGNSTRQKKYPGIT
jgi:hypothetical protein